MNESKPERGSRKCRWFFIGTEILFVLAWCGLLVENHFAERGIWSSGVFCNVCALAFGISIVVLLFVLPWFWSTLRHLALIGWLMGFGSLLYGLLAWR